MVSLVKSSITKKMGTLLQAVAVAVLVLVMSVAPALATTYGGNTYGGGVYNVGEVEANPTSGSGSSGSSSSSSSRPSAPGCSDTAPAGTPDLFQIDRSGSQAKLFFTPVNDHVEKYHVVFGFDDGDERFGGISMPAQNENDGVQALVIDHLDPKASYSFKVISTNGCATGEWSNWLSTSRVKGRLSIFYRYWDQVRNYY